jgi:hypothetical protein
MTGRPLETGGPDQCAGRLQCRRRRAKQWAAAILFSDGLPCGGERHANFLPGDAFGKVPGLCGAPIPAMLQRGNGSGEALRSS